LTSWPVKHMVSLIPSCRRAGEPPAGPVVLHIDEAARAKSGTARIGVVKGSEVVAGRRVVKEKGEEELRIVAKIHHKTTHKIIEKK